MGAMIRKLLVAVLALVPLLAAAPAAGQDDCKMLFCSPKLTFLPSVTFVPAFRHATVATLRNGVPVDTMEVETKAEPAAVLSLGIPSTLPRTRFFVTVYWLPFADARENAFTEYTADELDEEAVAANSPVLEVGASFTLLEKSRTNGWLSLDGSVLDQFGPAAEPAAESDYTHKLALELQATASVFRWLSKDNWLRNVEAYATLDYTATGLPDEGDVVPDGERLWLEDAGPWQVWVGLVVPVAPIAP